MRFFGSNTKMKFKCEKCGDVESLKLSELPRTPGGKFLTYYQVLCFRCLETVYGTVYEENAEFVESVG